MSMYIFPVDIPGIDKKGMGYRITKADFICDDKGLYNSEKFNFEYRLYEKEEYNRIGGFTFSPMKGCCGIIISSYTWLDPKFRGGFASDAFRKAKEDFARHLGYSIMLATTQMHNIPAVGNMRKSGYKIVKTFSNKRTGNLLGLGIKEL